MDVFVETNWVVDFLAPADYQSTAASALMEHARFGNLVLHLPAICLTEARGSLLEKFKPGSAVTKVRGFLRCQRSQGQIRAEDDEIVRNVLDQIQRVHSEHCSQLDSRISALRAAPGVDVFPLSEQMLERAAGLAVLDLNLQPFDQAILAAVLIRAGALRAAGVAETYFCELDSDLLPWTKDGNPKTALKGLYSEAGIIKVFSNFDQIQNHRAKNQNNATR